MPDPQLVETALRRIVADEIAEQQRLSTKDGERLALIDQRQIARAILNRELDLRSREAMRLGEQPMTAAERQDVTDRVLAQVFSALPGLERFIDRADAVNVHVQGCREVVVELMDGTREVHPSPFASDDELIDAVAQVARRSGKVEKEFNFSHPMLHLTLPDGSRLSANAWIGSEAYLTIRRHPLVDHDLDDLCERGMFDRCIKTLLAAAVRARLNILFAGGQGNGKTTLLRAAAHAADPFERTLVLESEPELALDRSPERHRHVLGLWERPSNMEGDGAVTLADLAWHAKRMSPDRIIVGEVLGEEVIHMLEAMSQGVKGSMCTMHADSSAGVFDRLPIYARSGTGSWTATEVLQLAGLALDLVVFVARDSDGRRVVAEIRHIDRYDRSTDQIISDPWFIMDPVTRRAVPASVIPVHLLDQLVEHGYDPAAHDDRQGAWA
jgi:Flp pilus assembly CpaF family ATPase